MRLSPRPRTPRPSTPFSVRRRRRTAPIIPTGSSTRTRRCVRRSSGCAATTVAPAMVTDTAWRCCSKTAPSSSSTTWRSTPSAAESCRSIRTTGTTRCSTRWSTRARTSPWSSPGAWPTSKPSRATASTRWWQDVAATRATIVHYLGVVPPMLLNQPVVPAERQHAVKFGIGAGVEPELHEAFEKRFGFPLIEAWGMTETGRVTMVNREPRMVHTRAFGRPFGGLEAKVADEEDREVPRGTEGELLVRWGGSGGPRHGFFAGYLKDERATEEAWRGGWFHTGDVVRQDV